MEVLCRRLNASEFQKALAVRIAVFVDEQKVPLEEEQDKLDEIAWHYGAFVDNRLVGTGRVVVNEGQGRIGRIAVLKKYRQLGVGSKLMKTILDDCRKANLREAYLSSQLQAMPFYARLGFVEEGNIYDDAGIPHKTMRLQLLEQQGFDGFC